MCNIALFERLGMGLGTRLEDMYVCSSSGQCLTQYTCMLQFMGNIGGSDGRSRENSKVNIEDSRAK